MSKNIYRVNKAIEGALDILKNPEEAKVLDW